MTHVIIETGHQRVNNLNIDLIVIKFMMYQVHELGYKINYRQTGPILDKATK